MARQPAEDSWRLGGWAPVCKVCERNSLVRKKIFRMSWPIVGIGFLLLIPSILGMIVSILLLFGVLSSGPSDVARIGDKAVAQMWAVNVPQSVVGIVVKVTSEAIFLFGGRFAVALGIASLVGGLLGWLLVRKKRVLECTLCNAVIDAP